MNGNLPFGVTYDLDGRTIMNGITSVHQQVLSRADSSWRDVKNRTKFKKCVHKATAQSGEYSGCYYEGWQNLRGKAIF